MPFETLGKADCIIVLGAAVFGESVSYTLANRLDMAYEVYNAGKAPIVVTQKEHLLRALYIANRLGLSSVGSESLDYDVYEMQVQKPREFLARVKAFLQCDILHSKPKYLGKAIPVSGSGLLTED